MNINKAISDLIEATLICSISDRDLVASQIIEYVRNLEERIEGLKFLVYSDLES